MFGAQRHDILACLWVHDDGQNESEDPATGGIERRVDRAQDHKGLAYP